MKYYEIILNQQLIGAITSLDFMAMNNISKRLLVSNEEHGQFVVYEHQLYRDTWMASAEGTNKPFILATIRAITQEEYQAFMAAKAAGREISIIDDDDNPDNVIYPSLDSDVVDPDILLEYVRNQKILEMSAACKATIESGFDLIIHGELKHFSLSTQDQLNLMNLNIMAETQNLIPYHSDGDLCIFYTAEEIKEIFTAANNHKIYQTTYFNALKAYINSLETVAEITTIVYGIEIPEAYQSDVLRVLE